MKTNKRKRILVMALIAMIMAMPMSLIAQSNGQSDGFFNNWNNGNDEQRDNDSYGVTATNQTFGQAPLGSGMAILVASAAGYALLKRRNNNTKTPKHLKHLNLLLVLTMVSVLFTQCKKAEVVPQTNTNSNTQINISLNVGSNSKADVEPTSGNVNFEAGDKIYVASNGLYAGTLTCASTSNGLVFSGTITNPKEDDYLYFYFMGNQEPLDDLTVGSTTSISVGVFNQTETLPIISAGKSNKVFKTTTKSYSTTLENKCALVKLNVPGYTGNGDLIFNDMNNKVTVNLGNQQFTYSKVAEHGLMGAKKTDGNYWVVLLPQGEPTNNDAYIFNESWSGYVAVPAINANDYNTNGIDVNLHEYVDLGLPSKTLWATCNVGASTSGEFGNYYAWGEVRAYGEEMDTYPTGWPDTKKNENYVSETPKTNYSGDYYKWKNTTGTHKYTSTDGKTTLEFSDDAATANWGGKWQMPTQDDWNELINYCTWEWEKNGKYGYRVTATNGNSIFLPAAGYYDGVNCLSCESKSRYWSNLVCNSVRAYSLKLQINNVISITSEYNRYYGFSVRPVKK